MRASRNNLPDADNSEKTGRARMILAFEILLGIVLVGIVIMLINLLL